MDVIYRAKLIFYENEKEKFIIENEIESITIESDPYMVKIEAGFVPDNFSEIVSFTKNNEEAKYKLELSYTFYNVENDEETSGGTWVIPELFKSCYIEYNEFIIPTVAYTFNHD